MTVSLLQLPRPLAVDANGKPRAGAKMYVFAAGTSTPVTLYQDADRSTLHASPIRANTDGLFPPMYPDPSLGAIKINLTTADDVQIAGYPIDNIPTQIPASAIDFSSQRTAAEILANVVPVNFLYPPGNVLRYGAVGNGSTADDTAITNALLISSFGSGSPVVFPQGYTFKITSYIQIYSNTTIQVLGKIQLTNRASGFWANNQTNISIYGYKVGQIQDSSVLAGYQWNTSPAGNYNPAIHLRSCSSCLVEGLVISYVGRGIFFSDATSTVGPYTPGQTVKPVDCIARGNNIQFCEYAGVSLLDGVDCGFYENYVYRCGDGGMWMMGGTGCAVVNNHRVSPVSSPAAVALGAGPFNVLANPATWNDEQGIQFEACVDQLIEGNTVRNMWAQGIDIKNNCMRVLCQGNRLYGCENASIVVREGDAVKNACHKVTIRNNIIGNHGALLFNTPTGIGGAIRVGECYLAEVCDNTIYSYQNTPGINCTGPGTYLASQYPGNPRQASVTISGNTFDFKSVFQQQDPTEFQFMGNPPAWTAGTAFTLGQTVKPTVPVGYYFVCVIAGTSGGSQPNFPTALNVTVVDGSITWICQTTPPAIAVTGQIDSVLIDANHIRTDRYDLSDARFNLNAAIAVTYVAVVISAITRYYPSACAVNNNVVEGWGTHGISITGLFAQTYSGLTVNSNVLSAVAGSGITLAFTHKAICNGNSITQPGAGGGAPGIQINGSAGNLIDGVVCTGNAITGGYQVGGNSMTYGISTNYASNVNASNNVIAGATTANFVAANTSSPHVLQGSSGFPRSGAGSPNGAVGGFWPGEMYFDTSGSAWYACSTAFTTTWTKLSN